MLLVGRLANDMSKIFLSLQTRFTFTRLIAAAGVSVAQFIPTLASRLLAVVTDPSEIVDFISFLGFVFYSHLGVSFSVHTTQVPVD